MHVLYVQFVVGLPYLVAAFLKLNKDIPVLGAAEVILENVCEEGEVVCKVKVSSQNLG